MVVIIFTSFETRRNRKAKERVIRKGSTDPTCAGYISGTDMEDGDALCLDVDTCKSMCWNLDECVGIEMAKDGVPRCFLKLWECAGNIAMGTLLPDPTVDFMVKQVP